MPGYPMSKAKILLAPCQQNLLRCEVKIAQIPEAKAEHFHNNLIRTFSTVIECDTLYARS